MYTKIYGSWLKRSKYKVTASKPAEEKNKAEKNISLTESMKGGKKERKIK